MRILYTITTAIGLGEPGDYLAYLVRQLCLEDPFFAIYSSFCMGILKIYVFIYLSYWLHLLLSVCGDVESNPGPGSDKRVRVLYSNIRGLHANLDELAVAGLDYDALVCAESKVSDRRHLSELGISGFDCPKQRLRNTIPGALFMLRKDSDPSGRVSWSVLAMNPACFVFAVG